MKEYGVIGPRISLYWLFALFLDAYSPTQHVLCSLNKDLRPESADWYL